MYTFTIMVYIAKVYIIFLLQTVSDEILKYLLFLLRPMPASIEKLHNWASDWLILTSLSSIHLVGDQSTKSGSGSGTTGSATQITLTFRFIH